MVSSIGNDSGSVAQILQQQRQQVDAQQAKQAQSDERQDQIKKQEVEKAEQQKSIVDDSRGRTVDINV